MITTPLARAAAIVRSAEASLRELMQSAVAAGDYRDLPALVRIAEQLSEAATKLDQPASLPPTTDNPTRRSVPSGGRAVKPGASAVDPRLRSRAHTSEYPSFRRDGERLVKIGWSKSDRSEYRHRAPKHVARTLLAAISALDPAKGLFTVEQLLPLADPTDGRDIAPHQVYVALAWFKAEGIVMQHGRDGYSLLAKSESEALLEERWRSLQKDTQ